MVVFLPEFKSHMMDCIKAKGYCYYLSKTFTCETLDLNTNFVTTNRNWKEFVSNMK